MEFRRACSVTFPLALLREVLTNGPLGRKMGKIVVFRVSQQLLEGRSSFSHGQMVVMVGSGSQTEC
jgi:hypothetical protein